MSVASTLVSGGLLRRLRYRYSLRLFLSELLAKRWMEPAIPFALMIGLIAWFSATTPYYATLGNAQQLGREFAEAGFVAVAMALTVISGGIDLSVGSVFALANLAALVFYQIFNWPVGLVIAATLGIGAAVGAINGYLIGYLRTRPFLTTLVTLIVLRATVDLLGQHYSVPLAMAARTSWM